MKKLLIVGIIGAIVAFAAKKMQGGGADQGWKSA